MNYYNKTKKLGGVPFVDYFDREEPVRNWSEKFTKNIVRFAHFKFFGIKYSQSLKFFETISKFLKKDTSRKPHKILVPKNLK